MTTQLLVPLHTYPDGNASTLVPHVVAMARHLGADIHAAMFLVDFPHVRSLLGNLLIDADDLARTARARSRQNASDLSGLLEAAALAAGIPFGASEIACYPEELGDRASKMARYHDITLLGIGSHEAALRATAEDVVFGAGRPVLLVPEDLAPAPVDHVAIAWDGSRVAARAVRDAWPFLGRARQITVFCAPDEKELPDDIGDRLLAYLGHHDLVATLANVSSADRSISETLQQSARAAGAGLLVMGGYGHSRMREFVLGGATQGVLDALSMPVLMAH